MKPQVLTILLSFTFKFCFSQGGGLAAYTDYLNRFYIFDHGKKMLTEEQKVKSFKVGGNCIAYVDYADNFKIYQNGEVKTIEIGAVRNYIVTNHLVAYTMTDILKVYDNGKVTTLSSAIGDFSVGDSLIAYFDTYFNSINGYYKGKIFSRRLRLVGATIKRLEAGPNIAGVITAQDRDFFIFFRGEIHTINQFVDDLKFKVGRDIVAYMDQPTRTFKAFYKGDIYDVENFEPDTFLMGDGRIVYLDVVGNFKTFYEGNIATIITNSPTFFQVKDSMIVYQELDRFKCFYNGRVMEIAPYIPEKFVFERSIVAYLDQNRRLQIFQNGVSKPVINGSDVMINDFAIYRDVVVINVDVNRNMIYYNGTIY